MAAVANGKVSRGKRQDQGRVSFWGLFCLVIFMLVTPVQAKQVTDIAGRTVQVPAKVERILLGEGRLFYALALLEGDQPFKRIVGWQGDMRLLEQQNFNLYHARFPQIESIPLIGQITAESTSAEQALKLNPDIAIFGIAGHGAGLSSELVKQLEKAGIPVVFVDFRLSPLKNTLPSIRVLGKVLHRQAQAEKYIAFYQQEFDKVKKVVATIPQDKRPTVFIDLKAGTGDCCGTAGNGNMGDLIEAAGGRNIAKNLLPGALGQINLEQVLASQPDLYIATGSINPDSNKPGLKMGAATSADLARSSLQTILQQKGISSLNAVQQGRVHGLWHSFYTSPYNVLAIQVIAKWLYPVQFKDLHPDQTLQQLYSHYLPVKATGTYWISLTGSN